MLPFRRSAPGVFYAGGRSATTDDLLLGRLAELVGGHLQPFGQFAVSQNLHLAAESANEPGLRKLLDTYLRPIIKPFQLGDVHNLKTRGELLIVETALGQPSEEGHLPTLAEREQRRSRPAPAAFVPPATRLSVARAPASSDPLASLVFPYDRSNFMT